MLKCFGFFLQGKRKQVVVIVFVTEFAGIKRVFNVCFYRCAFPLKLKMNVSRTSVNLFTKFLLQSNKHIGTKAL